MVASGRKDFTLWLQAARKVFEAFLSPIKISTWTCLLADCLVPGLLDINVANAWSPKLVSSSCWWRSVETGYFAGLSLQCMSHFSVICSKDTSLAKVFSSTFIDFIAFSFYLRMFPLLFLLDIYCQLNFSPEWPFWKFHWVLVYRWSASVFVNWNFWVEICCWKPLKTSSSTENVEYV